MRKAGFRFAGLAVVGAMAALCGAPAASADVFSMSDGNMTSLTFQTVGDPGNAPNVYKGYDGNPLGTVAYVYSIGTFPVTAAQYCTFLNATATTSDPFGLYDPVMRYAPGSGACGISQTGSPGSYSYTLTLSGYAVNNGNFPVNLVTWGSAARFCNWLTNGQPVGPEGAGTTETGSYTLNGAIDDANLMGVTRNASAKYALPTANEWYKAAYYKGGSTSAGYWFYPTESNAIPSNVLSATGTNNANYFNGVLTDPVNILTQVGAFASSPGPYGTFDMGGDVVQWCEANYLNYQTRLTSGVAADENLRGDDNYILMDAKVFAVSTDPSYDNSAIGFRVVELPEPGALFLLGSLSLWILSKRRTFK
jgi:formylglycine-generating enzyme required for sulfatase activity